MNHLFSLLALVNIDCDVICNIVSIGSSQDLFDDLTNSPEEWAIAQQVEGDVKPPPYRSETPVIYRPFEDADWFNAIEWPFTHWQASRFSDGSFGVWYGSDSAETSVYETAYHWFSQLLADAGFQNEKVVGERKLYNVTCDAALVDLRPLAAKRSDLNHKTDYTSTQSIGAKLHREGHPGLVTTSVRHSFGQNYVVLNPGVLSNPGHHCQLTYRLDGNRIFVEKQPGTSWMEIATAALT